jgi:hypothetical protein
MVEARAALLQDLADESRHHSHKGSKAGQETDMCDYSREEVGDSENGVLDNGSGNLRSPPSDDNYSQSPSTNDNVPASKQGENRVAPGLMGATGQSSAADFPHVIPSTGPVRFPRGQLHMAEDSLSRPTALGLGLHGSLHTPLTSASLSQKPSSYNVPGGVGDALLYGHSYGISSPSSPASLHPGMDFHGAPSLRGRNMPGVSNANSNQSGLNDSAQYIVVQNGMGSAANRVDNINFDSNVGNSDNVNQVRSSVNSIAASGEKMVYVNSAANTNAVKAAQTAPGAHSVYALNGNVSDVGRSVNATSNPGINSGAQGIGPSVMLPVNGVNYVPQNCNRSQFDVLQGTDSQPVFNKSLLSNVIMPNVNPQFIDSAQTGMFANTHVGANPLALAAGLSNIKGLEHVSARTFTCALSGEFVNLEELVCSTIDCEEVKSIVDESGFVQIKTQKCKKAISSLYMWLEGWCCYLLILSNSYGQKFLNEMVRYQTFIIRLAQKFKLPQVLLYDFKHRQRLAARNVLNFTDLDHELYITIFDNNAVRNASRCAKCSAIDHVTIECPFKNLTGGGSNQGQGKSGRSSASRNEPFRPSARNGPGTKACYGFNEGGCTAKQCARKHVCIVCKGPDAIQNCKKCSKQ